MNNIRNIAVYAASSTALDEVYFEAAARLGSLLAMSGKTLVYGAGSIGLMGAAADSALKHNGKVIGVIPQFMVEQNWHHSGCTEMVVTQTMHERKAHIANISDAFVALPGGVGTFEELCEIITWKQLGLHTKPIVILNTNGYYDCLLRCFQQMVEQRFMRDMHLMMFTVVATPEVKFLFLPF